MTAKVIAFPVDRVAERALLDFAQRRIEFDKRAMAGGLSDIELVAEDAILRLDACRVADHLKSAPDTQPPQSTTADVVNIAKMQRKPTRQQQLAELAEEYLRIRALEDRGDRREQFVLWDAEIGDIAGQI